MGSSCPVLAAFISVKTHVSLRPLSNHEMLFVIDAFARRIVDWRVSSSMRTDFVLVGLVDPSPTVQLEWVHSNS